MPEIRGYRGAVRDVRALVERVQRARGVQLLRADRVWGADHLVLAARLAEKAVQESRSRSADVSTETLVYASGERQIGKALQKLGLVEGTREIAAVAWGADAQRALEGLAADEGWTRDDGVLAGTPEVLDHFDVPEEERALFPPEKWGELVLERVALVDVLKG